MPTYYDILKVAPNANSKDIEAAIDGLYEQWRRLVTHHDQHVADEANHSLRLIEEMRNTLLDTNKRAVYDTAIGLRGTTGGLADPEVLLRNAASRPSISSQTNIAGSPQTTVSGWVCGICQTSNREGARYCMKCGKQVWLLCPKCQSIVPANAAFCEYCGIKIVDFSREKLEALRIQLEDTKTSVKLLVHLTFVLTCCSTIGIAAGILYSIVESYYTDFGEVVMVMFGVGIPVGFLALFVMRHQRVATFLEKYRQGNRRIIEIEQQIHVLELELREIANNSQPI